MIRENNKMLLVMEAKLTKSVKWNNIGSKSNQLKCIELMTH